jgi:MoxR-like ATPase
MSQRHQYFLAFIGVRAALREQIGLEPPQLNRRLRFLREAFCCILTNELMTISTEALTEEVKTAGTWVSAVQNEISRVVVGQKNLVDRLLIGLLANGHVLLEGVPGLAKTLTIRTLAGCIQTGFRRLQFTPDLLPADIVGTLIYNPRDGDFRPKLGPIFSNLILADEINRAPAKVQSALLEAMQERQVTIGEQSYRLPDPFLVLATENPLEQEGTYQLPEAQLDRFMLKLNVDYPSKTEERQILDLMGTSAPNFSVQGVATPEMIVRSRDVVNRVFIDDRVKDYIVDLIWATRRPGDYQLGMDGLVRYGASPRATIYLTLAARAHAFIEGRGYVTPHDVKSVGPDVLRHRIIVSYEAEAEEVTSDTIVQRIFAGLPVP